MPEKKFTSDFVEKWSKLSDQKDPGFDCPVCQTLLPSSAEVCSFCGAVFADEEEAVYECPVCAAEVGEDDSQCPKCGAIFAGEDEADISAMEELVEEEDTVLILDELEDLLGIEETKPAKAAPPRPPVRPSEPDPRPQRLIPPEREGVTTATPRERGLTNGMGRTNGLGRIPPKDGLTNGVGRTNGLTNGVGRTNGLTNGVGRTNGLTNGVGRTNGLTNGVSTGLTNGLRSMRGGITNGNGLTNGLSRTISRRAKHQMWKVGVIPLVAVMMLLVTVVVNVTYIPQYDGLVIDGDFADWENMGMASISSRTEPSFNQNVDIIETSAHVENGNAFFFVRVRGEILAGQGGGYITDNFQLLVDSDADDNTGLQTRGIGADWLISVSGINGNVHQANLYRSVSAPDGSTGWNRSGSAKVAASGDSMEIMVSSRAVGLDENSLVLFHSSSWDSWKDYSDVVVPLEGESLGVGFRPDAPSIIPSGGSNVASMDIRASMGDITIRSIALTMTGTATGTPSLQMNFLGQRYTTTVSNGRAVFDMNLNVDRDTSATATITATPSESDAGKSMGFEISSWRDIVVENGIARSWNLAPLANRDYRGYVISSPIHIAIDGAFADWQSYDRVSESSSDVNQNIDVASYSLVMENNMAHFYVETRGNILEGAVISFYENQDTTPKPPAPAPTPTPTPTPSPEPTPAPPRWMDITTMPGEDYFHAYLDTDMDHRTGFRVDPDTSFGADYRLAIGGKNGMITSKTLERYSAADGWETVGSVGAANGHREIEAGISLVDIGSPENVRVIVISSSWEGDRDMTGSSPQMTRGRTRSGEGDPEEKWHIQNSSEGLEGNKHLDIVSSRFILNEGAFRSYFNVSTPPTESDSWVARVFIDSDMDSATGYWVDSTTRNGTPSGYIISGIGADYIAEVYGVGSDVISTSLMEFSGDDKHHWSWTWTGEPGAWLYNDRTIRVDVPSASVASSAASAIFSMSSLDGGLQDATEMGMSSDTDVMLLALHTPLEAGYLEQGQKTDVSLLEMRSSGGTATITAIGGRLFRYSTADNTDVPKVWLGEESSAIGIDGRFNISDLSIEVSGTETLTISLEISAAAVSGRAVSFAVDHITTGAYVTINTPQIPNFYIDGPSVWIEADGLFDDWHSIIPKIGSESDSPSTDMKFYNAASPDDDSIAFYINVEEGIMAGMKSPHVVVDSPPSITDNTQQIHKNNNNALFSFLISDDKGVASVELEYNDGSWNSIPLSIDNGVWEYTTPSTYNNLNIPYKVTATDNAGQETVAEGTIVFGAAPVITDHTPQARANGQTAYFEARVTSMEGVTGVSVDYGATGGMTLVSGDEYDGIYSFTGPVYSDTTVEYVITATDGSKDETAPGSIVFSQGEVETFKLEDGTPQQQENGNALFSATSPLATVVWVNYGVSNQSMTSGWTYTTDETFSNEALEYIIWATDGSTWLSTSGTITFSAPVVTPEQPSSLPETASSTGLDTTYILIDTDGGSTGYTYGGIEADHVVVITGRDGLVVDSILYKWGTKWNSQGAVATASGMNEMETKLTYSDLGLLERNDIKALFKIVDWKWSGTETPTTVLSGLGYHNVSNLQSTGFTISFTTPTSVESSILLDGDGDGNWGTGTKTEYSNPLGASRTHHITVTGLQSSTTYLYTIKIGSTEYSNNGAPWSTRTLLNQEATNPPASHTIYGNASNSLATGEYSLVYIHISQGGNTSTLMSTYADEDGNYILNLGNARRTNGRHFSEDLTGAIIKVRFDNGAEKTQWLQGTVETSPQQLNSGSLQATNSVADWRNLPVTDTYLTYGTRSGTFQPIADGNGTSGDMFGWNVSWAGDLNNNGYDDIIIGSPGSTTNIAVEMEKVLDIKTGGGETSMIPFSGTTSGSYRFQALYTKESISAKGNITDIYFHQDDENLNSGTYNNVRVWLCPTSINTIGQTFDDNYDGNTPTLVYEGTLVISDSEEWIRIELDDVFFFDNTENLLIELRWNTCELNSVVYLTRSSPGDGNRYSAYAISHTASSGSWDSSQYDLRLGMNITEMSMNGAGQSHIFFGWSGLDMGSLNASNANVTINGTATDGQLGWDVSGGGDVNGDGKPDIIIGEPGNGSGAAYIFHGRTNWNRWYNTGDANQTITGESTGDRFGHSVAIAGDVDRDGTNDVVVGAPDRDHPLAEVDATLFSENFTGVTTGSVPTGWTRTDATRWSVQATANAGGTSPELRFQYSATATDVYRCYTPAIDTRGYTQLSLSFKHFVNNYDGTGYPYSVRVETSTDGITWTTAWSVSPTGTANIGPATVSSTIAGDKGAGSNTLYISWTFSGQTFGINYWYIDDIVLTGTAVEKEYGAAYVFYGSENIPSYAESADEKYVGFESTGRFGSAVAGVGDVDDTGYDNFAIGEPGRDKAYINQKSAEANATGETAVAGNVTNTYTATQTQDDTYQSVGEVAVAGSDLETETLRPDGAGFANTWGSGTYASVNDQSDATYLESSGVGQVAYFSLDNTTVGEGTIYSVIFYVRAARSASAGNANPSFRLLYRTHDTNYQADAVVLNSADYATWNLSRTTNPSTGNAWTWSEIDALQAGASGTTDGSGGNRRHARVSEVWVEVNYFKDSYGIEHKWNFTLGSSERTTFAVDAYYAAEGASFYYSTTGTGSVGGAGWTKMLTVNKTADDNTYQTYSDAVLSTHTGTIYVGVRDDDRTGSDTTVNTLYVDHMRFIQQKPLWPIQGPTSSSFGFSISAAGDINNDGIDDMLIGAPGSANGTAYLYYGGGIWRYPTERNDTAQSDFRATGSSLASSNPYDGIYATPDGDLTLARKILLDDDFEDNDVGGNPAGWTCQIASYTSVVSTPTNSGNRSVRLTDSSTEFAAFMYQDFEGETEVVIEFYIYYTVTGQQYNVLIMDSDGALVVTQMSWLTGSVYYFYDDGGGAGVEYTAIGTYTTGTWQHIRIIADSDTDKVDIYIDDMDTPAVSQGNFYEPTDDIGFIQIATSVAGTGTFYVDDVFIYTPYETPGTFVSAPLTSTQDIESAIVSWNATLNSQNLTVSVSRDGGTTWTTVSNGIEYSFTGSEPVGKELKYRLQMNTSNTLASPVVHYVTMSYVTDSSLNYVNFTGASSSSRFGWSVGIAGDIDNDGYGDIIIGAPYNGTGGAIYVFNGTGGDWNYSDTVDAVNANYTWHSSTANELFGWSVDAAYNIRDSDKDAVVVGAPGNSTPAADSGAAYVLQVAAVVPVDGVTLNKSADVTGSIGTGDEFNYTIAFEIYATIDDLWINDTLASGLTYLSSHAYDSDGAPLTFTLTSHGGGSYTWHFTNLQAGTYHLNISVRYTGPEDGRTLENTANATWTGDTNGAVSNAVYVPVIPTFSDMALPVFATLAFFLLVGNKKEGKGKKRRRLFSK